MRTNYLIFTFIVISLFTQGKLQAQIHSRFEAEFSIKEKDINGNKLLTVGKVYYDKTIKKIVFNISFPVKQVLIFKDSLVYQFDDDTLTKISPSGIPPEFTVYHLALNGNLEYFGLKESHYILAEVEEENDLIITSWTIPNSSFGKIMLSQKNKKLTGLISFDKEENILSKQFFEDYKTIYGFEFPTRIIQYIYVLDRTTIKMTTYRNIKVNEMENNSIYDYPLPDSQ